MPVEPAPIADPHSMSSIPAETAPRTTKTVVQSLVFVVVGALFLKMGLNAADAVLERARYRVPTYGAFGVYDVSHYVTGVLCVLFFCPVGAMLIWQGLRVWKHGR